MTITTEISKLQENLANAYSTIEEKGATLPSAQNFDNLANAISSIPSATSYTAGTGIDITNDVISVTSDISTGATLGATAVQLADLASVATSGSYNDLSNKPDLNGKANIDLSNITSAGKNIANWSTNVTNCITEIPQDIKLELNNGTLTLKAGSKVYVPNGFEADGTTPKFDVVTIENDKTASMSSFSGFVFYRSDNNDFHFESLQPTSGTNPPSEVGTWYDTSVNKIKRYEYSSFVYDGVSFPLCKISSGSIDQVFNGFGYIGSTVFALPGIKGLISNGRNNDGTLKNIDFTTENVLTYTNTNNLPYTWVLQFNSANISVVNASNYIESDNEPTNILGWTAWFNTRDNINYLKNIGAEGASWVRQDLCNNQVKITTNSSNVITSFTPKTAFHAVDYNDVVLKQDLATIPHIVETYVNGTSWYRVYSDGWCEQGANNQTSDTNGGYTVTFLKPFKDTNYNVTGMTVDKAGGTQCVKYTRKSAASISFYTTNNTQYSSMQFNWQACGYIS